MTTATAFNTAGKTPDQLGYELLRELAKQKSSVDEPKALALIAAGANPEVRSDENDTPLILAALNGHTEAGLALIAAKADVNAKEYLGYTALMLAASGGFSRLFDALLAANARIDEVNEELQSALYLSVGPGFGDMVGKLINAGAVLDNRARNGDTPAEAAHKVKQFEVAKTIEDAIAARDLPLREEEARKAYALAHIGDGFRDGAGADIAAPERAVFKHKLVR